MIYCCILEDTIKYLKNEETEIDYPNLAKHCFLDSETCSNNENYDDESDKRGYLASQSKDEADDKEYIIVNSYNIIESEDERNFLQNIKIRLHIYSGKYFFYSNNVAGALNSLHLRRIIKNNKSGYEERGRLCLFKNS